jgi:hypothetical protein
VRNCALCPTTSPTWWPLISSRPLGR